jgi:Trypsin
MRYGSIQRGGAVSCFVVGLAFVANPGESLAQDGDRPVDQAKKRLEQGLAGPEPGTTTKIVGGVGGNPAASGKFPFQAALIFSGTPEGSEHFGQFCGGSLISREWVLTAAHCVPGTDPDEVDVYVGSSVLPSGGGSRSPVGGIRGQVDVIIVHDAYDPTTMDNDIALLHLTGPVPAELGTVITATPEHDKQYAATRRRGAHRLGGDRRKGRDNSAADAGLGGHPGLRDLPGELPGGPAFGEDHQKHALRGLARGWPGCVPG